MSIRTYLKRSLPLILADIVVVNLGLFLGVLARYIVLVGLGEAPILLSHFTTPSDLWRESTPARVGRVRITSLAPWAYDSDKDQRLADTSLFFPVYNGTWTLDIGGV